MCPLNNATQLVNQDVVGQWGNRYLLPPDSKLATVHLTILNFKDNKPTATHIKTFASYGKWVLAVKKNDNCIGNWK